MVHKRFPRILIVFCSLVVALLLLTAAAAFAFNGPGGPSSLEQPVAKQAADDPAPVLDIWPDPVEVSSYAGATAETIIQVSEQGGISDALGVDLQATDLSDGAGHLLASSSISFDPASFDLPAGEEQHVALSLTVPADLPAGLYVGEIAATSPAAGTVTTALTVDTRPATLSISKQVDVAGSTSFAFYGDLGPFSLSAGETMTFSVNAGNHRIYEAPQAAWALADIACDNTYFYTYLNALWVSLSSGEQVSCTFRNENEPLSLNMQVIGQLGGQTDAVAVQGDYAYLAEGPVLAVLDVSDPANPAQVGRSELLPGLVEDVVASGDYVYLAVGGSGLHIFDVSDPSLPTEVGFLKTPGYAFGVALSGNHAVIGDGEGGLRVIDVTDPAAPALVGFDADETFYVYDVVAQGDFIYASGGSGAAHGFWIYDISDPTDPVSVGGSMVAADSIWDIFISGNFLYVATDEGLIIFDVSDPANINEAATYGDAAFGVAVLDDLAYLTTGGAELHILDVSDPSDPALAGELEVGGDPREIAVLNDYAYATDKGGGLHVLDIGDPAEPLAASFYDVPFESGQQIATTSENSVLLYSFYSDTLQGAGLAEPSSPAPQEFVLLEKQAADLLVAKEHAYVADGDLRIFTLADPAGPLEVGFLATPGDAQDLALSGAYVVVADGAGGLRIVDVSDPSAPSESGHAEGSFVGVAVDGDYAFAVGPNGLSVIDISNPEAPTFAGQRSLESLALALPGHARDIAVAEGYAYALSYHEDLGNLLHVIDISNPQAPFIAGSHALPGSMAYDLAVDGAAVYVADGWDGLRVIDATDPAVPVEAGFYNTPGVARDVALLGRYAAVADGDGGLLILRHVTAAQQNGITIAKETEPAASGSFSFTGDLGSFALSGGEQEVFSELTPGIYTVTEADATGWVLDGIVCDSAHAAKDEHGVTIELGEGEHITCTFHNSRLSVTADAGGPYEGNEGSWISLDARGTSHQEMVATYKWDCMDDGFFEKTSSNPADRSCKYADNGSYTVRLRTIDIFGQTSEDTAAMTVNNVAPAVTVGPDQEATVGELLTFSGSFTDPGTADTHTIGWDFGDGSTMSGTLVAEHAFAAVGPYTVTLSVTDDDGGTGTAALIVDVVNSPPGMSNVRVTPDVIDEGESFYLSGALHDPEGDTLTLFVDWGDGKALTRTFPSGAQSFSLMHPCPDDPPGTAAGETYTISLKLSDEWGAFSEATVAVEVDNVAPTIEAGPDQENVVGETAVFSAAVSDPGMMDTLTVTWDFGDGSPTAEGVTVDHVYAGPGTFTVTATVEDDDGGVNVDTLTVTAREVFIFYLPVFPW